MSRFSKISPSTTFKDRLEFWENRSNNYSAVSDPSDFNRRYKPEYSDDSDDVETKSLQPVKKKKVRFRNSRKLKSESPHELSLKIRGRDTCKTKKEKKSILEKGTGCLPSSDLSSIDCQSDDGFLSSTLNTHEGSSSVEEKRLNQATSNYTLNCGYTGDELALNGAHDGSTIRPSLSSGPQNIFHIEKSFHIENAENVAVNTGDANVPAFARSSSRRISSRKESDWVRNTVAVDTSDILEERRRVSVKTKRFKEARRLLHNGKQFLILVGYQQDGLSSLGYDLLLEFPERENFVVDNPDQVLTCLSGEKSSIIFADDIFGTTYFDVGRFEDWQRNMGRIKRLLKKHNGILLLGLHLELTEEVKCKPFYDNYQDDILNISIPDLQLDRNEMKNILTRNISVQKEHLKIEICKSLSEEKNKMENENPCPINCIISEETIDNISKTANPSGFPGEVALFTKNVDNINRGEMFFSLPSDRLFSEIEELRNADKSNSEQGMHKYLALIAVFIYGKLNLEKMEAHSKYLKKSEKQLNAYLALCFGKQRRLVSHDFPNMSAVMIGVAKRFKCLATVAESVKKGVQKLLGRYLVESKRGRIEFASISVERTVAICCAKEYPEEVIMFSSSHVFEHVIGPNDIFADKQLHVPITNTGKPVRALIKRLLTLDGEQILQHPAMQSGWFAGLFVQYLQKDKHKFTTFVESSGNNTGTCVLTLSLKSPYRPSSATRSSCLAEDVIMSNQWQTIRNRNPSFADERENELLKKCCEMGWENAYLRMRDKLQKSLTRLCLILAINSCSTKIIIDMIQNRGRTLTICDWYYALEHACKKLDEDDKKTLNIILLITRKKVNFEYQNGSIGSIIHRAADSGNDLLLGKVLALCGNKDLQNAIGKTCLHLATAGNHLSCVRIAIENGVSQHIVDACGELPIHYACRHGFLEIADILIAHDGNVVNRASELGQTPLHLAAKHGNVSVIRLLLKQGASANASTKNQELPAHFALAKGYDEALRLLTNAMVFNFPDLTINKLFDKSVKLRNRVAIEMILDKIVYEQDRLTLLNFCLGETLKRRATDPANTDIVAYLLEKGADLFLSGLIEFRCSGTIKRLLIDKGFELNVLDAYRGVFRIKLRPKST